MKQCPTCQEEFADKFGFCPVDGTPLAGKVAPAAVASQAVDEPSSFNIAPMPNQEASNGHAAGDGYAYAADGESTRAAGDGLRGEAGDGAGAAAHDARGEYHLTILEETGLTRRLVTELRTVAQEAELTWPEFKRDPVGFTRRSASAYGQAGWKFVSQRNVALAMLTSFTVIFLLLGGLFALDRYRQTHKSDQARINEDLELVGMLDETDIPKEQEKPDKGPAGMAKGKGGGSKPQQEKPGGGGGGGRQEQLPASYGKLPPASQIAQILAPNPHPPAIKNPSLPVTPTIQADPTLFPPDTRPLPYGDPKSKATELSSGTGTGGGIGNGTGTGVGPGEGKGFGPGRGENTGGGDPHYGGGGPGGGGGGGPEDFNKTFKPSEVTMKAVIISKPEPGFTEEARKNNVTGTVRLRAVLASNGTVTNVSVIKPLPDGLTEKAIAAVKAIKFRPAQKDGRAVSQWITLEYNFNIY